MIYCPIWNRRKHFQPYIATYRSLFLQYVRVKASGTDKKAQGLGQPQLWSFQHVLILLWRDLTKINGDVHVHRRLIRTVMAPLLLECTQGNLYLRWGHGHQQAIVQININYDYSWMQNHEDAVNRCTAKQESECCLLNLAVGLAFRSDLTKRSNEFCWEETPFIIIN